MVENKSVYVLDACVILKWIFDYEHDAEKALNILDKLTDGNIVAAVPVHAFFEITNIMSIKGYDSILNFLSFLLYLGIEEYQFTLGLTAKALEIVENCSGVIFYDAVYHALAMKLGGTFVTADEKYFQKTKHLKQVMLLKDYK